ncbi:hypothetical protein [Bradyrhizobium ganzhouense]|uniref:hypothetical protein n=1 Tax=Bradyrhizobium ganzhouense TaxID=1179767 RepID=UPI003CFAD030
MTNFDYAMQKPSSLDIAIRTKPVLKNGRQGGLSLKNGRQVGLSALTERDRVP